MLKDLDLLIIDLHDIGVRCFTYLSSLKLALMAAKENNLPVMILDNPNPIYFWPCSGPELKNGFESFVGMVNVTFMHDKTIGQIAQDLNKKLGADLTILNCSPKKSWPTYFTTHDFIPPSPNLPTLDSVYAYPATVFIEGTNYSEGRGTKYPFQQIGAPWVDGQKLAQSLNSKKLKGVYFEPIKFKPEKISGKAENPKHKDKKCEGVFVHFYDLKNVDPTKIAFVLLQTLFEMYPEQSEWIKSGKNFFVDNLVGSAEWRERIS